ncbi:hypothetical protein H4Q26_018260, partial [Puccinia striiformis f. sp. tritici PST-130]
AHAAQVGSRKQALRHMQSNHPSYSATTTTTTGTTTTTTTLKRSDITHSLSLVTGE